MSLIKLHSLAWQNTPQGWKFYKTIFVKPELIRCVQPIEEDDKETLILDKAKISRMSDIPETKLQGSCISLTEKSSVNVAESAEYVASLLNK